MRNHPQSLAFLQQHQCTIERERVAEGVHSQERFPNNTHCTTTYRRPVFNFVPCSLIFPGQQLIRHGTQRRTCWTVPFLARPPYPPLDLLIYIASSIDNFSFKKRIDSSFNRHLLRNFLSFDHFTATTTITSFPISLAI